MMTETQVGRCDYSHAAPAFRDDDGFYNWHLSSARHLAASDPPPAVINVMNVMHPCHLIAAYCM